MMISIWHLVWVVPLSMLFGMILLGLIAAVSPDDPLDMDREDFQRHDKK